MLTGSTANVMDTFKQILADMDLVGGENAGNVILAKIKVQCQIDILWRKISTP